MADFMMARWLRGQCARRAVAAARQRSQWSVMGWVTKISYLELLRASEGTLSCWSRLHLQVVVPTSTRTGPAWWVMARSPCVIHKEGPCPSSGDINRLMMSNRQAGLHNMIKNMYRPHLVG
jgi:hypothetical protein